MILNLLAGLIFNLVWIVGAAGFGWLLTQAFHLVDLPRWLEFAVIVALSFWVGLMGMAMFIQRLSGESWSDSRRFVGLMFVCALPTLATCFLGVASYFFIHLFGWNAKLEKSVVCAVCGLFWFSTMHLTIQKFEKQAKK